MIGCSPGNNLKPALDMPARNRFMFGKQLVAQIVALLGEFDGLERRADDRWRQRVGKQIGPGPLAHQIDDRLGGRNEAARRPPSALPSVPVIISALMPPAPACPRPFGPMKPVAWQSSTMMQRVIPVGQRPDFPKLREIAIHREHAVGDDDDAPRSALAALANCVSRSSMSPLA